MAVALAAVKLGALVVAGLLVGWAGVRPAEAATTTITLSADGYLVGLCQNVELTVDAISDLNNFSEILTLQHFEDGETLETLTDWDVSRTAIDAGITRTHTVNYCERTTRFFRAHLRGRLGNPPPYAYGDVISVEWVHPSDLGLVKTTDAVFTSVSPVITDADYSPATAAGVAATDGTVVRLRWGPIQHVTDYEVRAWPVPDPSTVTEVATTDDSDVIAGALEITLDDIFTDRVRQVAYTFVVRGILDWTDELAPLFVATPAGQVLVSPGQYLRTAYSEPVTVVLKPGSSDAPINTTDPGEPTIVAPGTAQEGINEVAQLIAEQTGMGTGASTTLLPLLCLLLAGAAAAVVMLPLGFSPLSLGAGFLVFTLVWSVGGVAWFALPIAMAALPPVLLAACGVMIFRQRGMFG